MIRSKRKIPLGPNQFPLFSPALEDHKLQTARCQQKR